ncbi:Lysine exporter protein (LYSE/YGGA) [Beutenbergia cavernae DSM 12333]|uniref:Lysine exporter protein (LYSE/YGGA) n=1 Tax=Beutenbergia cavernae (strain ATCC BAA-8 / DSM 12333 / CCUG 43141 / JCM 11478 / NBRC 16432 / NCIMB 13614 / HKI 0122) TaxID=471853 RepID=C5C3Z4_BEUC1|nr:LysE/ArgO family amino acid transporter [Beutenbergia cavernae]ACQ79907.1 Lysine exporter protein (LYSE/YGGA) [Beutenbergia cavernae DSM 12333]
MSCTSWPRLRSVAPVPASVLATLSGLVTGLGLIVAIGAQNTFVLRQGLRREHVGRVVAVCLLSDVALIVAGVGGIGTLVERLPAVVTVLTWAGAAFLAGYGVLAARRALSPDGALGDAAPPPTSGRSAVAVAAALTWLNPHVYLDTVVLLGSVANAQPGVLRWWFAAGAVVASAVWFGGLGFGARLVAPALARPNAWRILDGAIAVVMLTLAVLLVLRA